MALTMLWIALPAVAWSLVAWAVLDLPPRSWSRAVAAVRRRQERQALERRAVDGDGAGADGTAESRTPGDGREASSPVGPSGWSGWHRADRRPSTAPDPFDVLVVQVQLGRLSAQLRDLEADAHAWARGRRILATQAAYDALLAEACRLAGVPVEQEWSPEPWGPTREPERFREEMELASRGWSW